MSSRSLVLDPLVVRAWLFAQRDFQIDSPLYLGWLEELGAGQLSPATLEGIAFEFAYFDARGRISLAKFARAVHAWSKRQRVYARLVH